MTLGGYKVDIAISKVDIAISKRSNRYWFPICEVDEGFE